MPTTRKPRPRSITSPDALGAAIEDVATRPGTTTRWSVSIPETHASSKLVTDRIRRVPRVKGWHALSIATVEATDTTLVLDVTSATAKATPWPTSTTTKKAAAKKAPATKQSKKAPATKRPARKPAAKKVTA